MHLDDLENLDDLLKDPVGKEDFIWGSQKVKTLTIKLNIQSLRRMKTANPIFHILINFQNQKKYEQGNFLQKLSDSLEESSNKIITELPVGSMIVANNHFWLHGRKPFKENKNLSRELLRIRGHFN